MLRRRCSAIRGGGLAALFCLMLIVKRSFANSGKLSSMIVALSFVSTSPTRSRNFPSLMIKHRIFQGVGMAAQALCFVAVVLSCFSSANILCASHDFQMFGIDAASNSAEVIQLHSFGYWTHKMLVNDTMSSRVVALPVAVGIQGFHPDPASGFGDRHVVSFRWYDLFSHCDVSYLIAVVRADAAVQRYFGPNSFCSKHGGKSSV